MNPVCLVTYIHIRRKKSKWRTRIDVYETLCPQQMLVHKGGKIKNWGGECKDVTPTNCSLKIYLKKALGGGGGGGSGWRGQDGCE